MIPFAIDALRSEPWRNGAGWTRTVCAREVDGGVLWRISVADITAASTFSQFEDMERTAVMVQGARLRLSNDAVQLNFDGIGSQIKFPGEWSLECSAPATATQLLNIMVRRGRAQALVEVVKGAAFTLNPGGAHMVLVLRGQFGLQSDRGARHTVLARHGVYWQQVDTAWRFDPVGSDALVVCCTLSC